MAEWYYRKNGQKHGPVDTATLKRMAIDGELDPSDLIWREGLAQWVAASQAKGLFPEPVPLSEPEEFAVIAPAHAATMAVAPPPPPAYTPPQPVAYATPQPYYAGASQTMGYQAPAKSYKGMATTAMVLSICGLFCFGFITGVLAVIFAGVALSGMGRVGNDDGKGMAITGLVLGIIDIIGWLIWLGVSFG